MHKFFVEPEDVKESEVIIKEYAPHISRVLRLASGDEIIVYDGSGKEYLCILSQTDKKECKAKILSVSDCLSEPDIKVSLFQGVPKASKMEFIIQKCVELGIYEIIPVLTKYTVVRFENEKDKIQKMARWQKIAKEAAKQCGRGIIPIVHSPVDFEDAVSKMNKLDLKIMPYEVFGVNGRKDLKHVLSNNLKDKKNSSIGILIGPEGGFDTEEAETAKNSEIALVGLGNRILRTETAGMAVLSAIMYEYNEF